MESASPLGRKRFSVTYAVKRWAADAVSFSRAALLLPLLRFEINRSPWAIMILAVIIGTDLIDGRLARLLGTAGSRGALIDAACDVLVVLGAAIAAGLSDARYLALSAIMAVSFLSYACLSLVIGRFAYTRLGRYSGVVSYAVITTASVKLLFAGLGITLPAAAEWVVLSFAGVYLAAAAAENAAAIFAAREGRSQETAG